MHFKIAGGEFCLFDRFQATCSGKTLIFMLDAKFGRMKKGTCISESHTLGCYTDVIGYLDSKCSGRQYCSLDVSDIREVSVGCPKEVYSYLNVTYTCVNCKFFLILTFLILHIVHRGVVYSYLFSHIKLHVN